MVIAPGPGTLYGSAEKGIDLYVSEFTNFMNQLIDANPQWREEREAGRALLWDRKISLAEQQAFRAAEVPQPAYPYDVNCPQK